MKRSLKFACGVIMLSCAGIGLAAGQSEVGVVDMKVLFQTSPEAKKISANLNQKFSPQRDKLVKMGQELQADQQKFQKDKAVMSAADAAKLQDKIVQEKNTLQSAQTQFQKDVYQAQNQAMSQFMSDVQKAVKVIADQKSLTLVLPKSSVLYSKNELDITGQVVNAMH